MLITTHWKKIWNVNFFSILFQTRKWAWSIQQKEEENKNLRDHISLALMVKLKRGCVLRWNWYTIDIFFLFSWVVLFYSNMASISNSMVSHVFQTQWSLFPSNPQAHFFLLLSIELGPYSRRKRTWHKKWSSC